MGSDGRLEKRLWAYRYRLAVSAAETDSVGHFVEVLSMPTGKVKWFDPKKGYGFIVGEEGQDVFVHYTSIAGEGFRALKDGETVSYELASGDKGYQARNVDHGEKK